MQIDPAKLRQATDDIYSALLAAEDIAPRLQRFAEAANADGAAFVRDIDGVGQEMTATPNIAEAARLYLSGQTPPDPRVARVQLSRSGGFLGDFDSFERGEIEADAYYQEFLRPRGYLWHAAACLLDDGRGQTVLGLKRRLRAGHYERAELDALDAALPRLRAVAEVARAIALAEFRGAARGCGGRDMVVELDEFGRWLEDGPPLPIPDDASAVLLANGRVRAALRSQQPALDEAITAACRRPHRFATLVLTAADRKTRAVVRLAPITGSAVSVFRRARALLIVTPIEHHALPPPDIAAALAKSFALTRMEAEVAALVGSGWTPREAAGQLGLGEGTVRNHLKADFAKMAIRRQVQLSQIVSAIQA